MLPFWRFPHVMRPQGGGQNEAIPDGEMNTWRPVSYQYPMWHRKGLIFYRSPERSSLKAVFFPLCFPKITREICCDNKNRLASHWRTQDLFHSSKHFLRELLHPADQITWHHCTRSRAEPSPAELFDISAPTKVYALSSAHATLHYYLSAPTLYANTRHSPGFQMADNTPVKVPEGEGKV